MSCQPDRCPLVFPPPTAPLIEPNWLIASVIAEELVGDGCLTVSKLVDVSVATSINRIACLVSK